MKMGKKMIAVTAGASALAMLATAADARHQWRKYEWAYDGTPIIAPVVDNTVGGGWSARVQFAMDGGDFNGVNIPGWNDSSRIQSSLARSDNTGCEFVPGEIHVCNDTYGETGWLGIASISLNGNEIVAGITKLNDTYFAQPNYNTESWKQLVTCQEIGHDYGLAHQNENFLSDATTSCMEYTSWPEGNEGPDAHDYEQLERMYVVDEPKGGGGGDGGGGRGGPKNRAELPNVGNTPDSWGRAIEFLPNGKPFVYERVLSNGTRVVTHVTWTIEAAAEQGDHHHQQGPRQHSGDRHFDF